MSRDRGNRAPAWVADFLRPWYPDAEKTPNGRGGQDIDNTPGVAFEVKTGATWREAWVEQSLKYQTTGMLPVLLYLPPGMGAKSVAHAHAVIPLHLMMKLLEEAGYAPASKGN